MSYMIMIVAENCECKQTEILKIVTVVYSFHEKPYTIKIGKKQ